VVVQVVLGADTGGDAEPQLGCCGMPEAYDCHPCGPRWNTLSAACRAFPKFGVGDDRDGVAVGAVERQACLTREKRLMSRAELPGGVRSLPREP
jgi:hypothetical protein